MEGTLVTLMLGTNQGERFKLLEQAREMLERKVGPVVDRSSVYETEPWGDFTGERPQFFLNQAVICRTLLSPLEVLREIKAIERTLGRESPGPRFDETGCRLYENRPMDIDILFYGDLVLESSALTIPHPQMRHRRFVMEPLAEIMPGFVHPVLKISVQEIFNSIFLDVIQ